jgi:hypothetical protein
VFNGVILIERSNGKHIGFYFDISEYLLRLFVNNIIYYENLNLRIYTPLNLFLSTISLISLATYNLLMKSFY